VGVFFRVELPDICILGALGSSRQVLIVIINNPNPGNPMLYIAKLDKE
jgi:hypothetical protein